MGLVFITYSLKDTYCISVFETLHRIRLKTISVGIRKKLGRGVGIQVIDMYELFCVALFCVSSIHHFWVGKAWEFNSNLPQRIPATTFEKKNSVLAVKCDCWSASELFYSYTFFFWRNNKKRMLWACQRPIKWLIDFLTSHGRMGALCS